MMTTRAAGLPRLLLSLMLIGTVAAGCSKPALPPGPPADTAAAPPASVDAWLEYLTLEEKVGQLLWVGLPGTRMTRESEQLLQEGKVGGFIFFARQGSDPAVLARLTGQMQQGAADRERHTPGLIIAVDHEGGLVQRFGPPFTVWPGNMAIGATGSEQYAEEAARAMADELLAVGVNMNFGPDADVNNNPANPVIGIRSFGEDPALVGKLVAASVRGFQSRQLSAVAKHFPGHGDTDLDSHKALPTVGHPRERLDQVELVPFRSAIQAGTDAIMTAHVIFPAVATDGLPATLSPRVLTGLLKEELGYQGLVITDAMDVMKAITDNYGLERGLIMSVQAGADAVLVTESFGIQRALHGLMLKAVQEGEISRERLNDAVRRNLELKAKRGLLPGVNGAPAAKPSGVDGGAPVTQPDASVIGAEAHKALANQIGADALTLVRNKHLPLQLTDDQMVLVIGPAYGGAVSGQQGVASALGAGIKAQHDNVWEVRLDRSPSAAAIQNARQLAGQAAVIVYGVYNGQNYAAHQAFIQELIATGKPVIVVGLGEPYELTRLQEIENYIAAYGYNAPNIQGVGALLFGKVQPKGRLPVSIPGLYPVGHGLTY